MTASTIVSWRARASSLAALLLTAGFAACGSAPADDAKRRSAQLEPVRVLEQPTRIQRGNFILLRTRPEGLPARTWRLVSVLDVALNPALAQRIPVIVPGRYWLVPGIGQLCVVSEVPWIPGAGTVCASTRQVIAQGFATITFTSVEQAPAGAPSRLLVGIAPDHAGKALVHTRGSVTVVPVDRGTFVVRDSVRVPSDFIELRRTR